MFSTVNITFKIKKCFIFEAQHLVLMVVVKNNRRLKGNLVQIKNYPRSCKLTSSKRVFSKQVNEKKRNNTFATCY